MSIALIAHSPDLQQLIEDGFEVEIRHGHLLISHVPYRNYQGVVAYGTLVSPLELAEDRTITPNDHVTFFVGGVPHDTSGQKLGFVNDTTPQERAPGLVINLTLSCKPPEGYSNYFEKMTTYIDLISGPARMLDDSATARTYKAIDVNPEESVFEYMDTFSARIGISAINEQLAPYRVAVVGAGGTGAYILDFLAKTPVAEIHIYDGDRFAQHNAFRMPGAACRDDFSSGPTKVSYLLSNYSKMRRAISGHSKYIDESNVEELTEMDFVFIAIDDGPSRKLIVTHLESVRVPYIDVGIGIKAIDQKLCGMARLTVSTPERPALASGNHGMSFEQTRDDDLYDSNIQISEINAINAAMAVVKWKKLVGFYADLENEDTSAFGIEGNNVINEKATGWLEEAA